MNFLFLPFSLSITEVLWAKSNIWCNAQIHFKQPHASFTKHTIYCRGLGLHRLSSWMAGAVLSSHWWHWSWIYTACSACWAHKAFKRWMLMESWNEMPCGFTIAWRFPLRVLPSSGGCGWPSKSFAKTWLFGGSVERKSHGRANGCCPPANVGFLRSDLPANSPGLGNGPLHHYLCIAWSCLQVWLCHYMGRSLV